MLSIKTYTSHEHFPYRVKKIGCIIYVIFIIIWWLKTLLQHESAFTHGQSDVYLCFWLYCCIVLMCCVYVLCVLKIHLDLIQRMWHTCNIHVCTYKTRWNTRVSPFKPRVQRVRCIRVDNDNIKYNLSNIFFISCFYLLHMFRN